MGMPLDRERVVTKNGRGCAVYRLPLPDGRILVEYPWGGGELVPEKEVFKLPTPGEGNRDLIPGPSAA